MHSKMNNDEVRNIIVDIGKKLLLDNLTVRTWGNISARVGSDMCAITPSGYSYNKLRPDDIVISNIHTFEYSGSIKPSSELQLHCGIYRIKSNVNFIIHTHQKFASVLSCSSSFLELTEFEAAKSLGSIIPVVEYAESGTEILAANTIDTFKNYDTFSVFLANHGAVCCGSDSSLSYERVKVLENISKQIIFSKLPEIASGYNNFLNNKFNLIGCFCERCLVNDNLESDFFMIYDGKKKSKLYKVNIHSGKITFNYTDITNFEVINLIPFFCRIFELRSDINFISLSEMPASFYFSVNNNKKCSIPVFLDDFAQICGEEILCIDDYNSSFMSDITLSKTNSIVLNKIGMFCYCKEEADMFPLKEIAEKNILTFLLSERDKTFKAIDKNIVKKMHRSYLEDYSLRINSF